LAQGSDSAHSRGVRYSRQETLGSISTDQYRLHKNIHALSHDFLHKSIFLVETKRQFHLRSAAIWLCYVYYMLNSKLSVQPLLETQTEHALSAVLYGQCSTVSSGSLRTSKCTGITHSLTQSLTQSILQIGRRCNSTVTGLFNIISDIN